MKPQADKVIDWILYGGDEPPILHLPVVPMPDKITIERDYADI